jgi:transcriptional regulator with XRE-family HTH domain
MNIARIRSEKGLTQEVVAKKAKVHRVTLARIETGERMPSLRSLSKIAKALGVDMKELL